MLTGNKVILADVNAETGLICRESVQKIVNEYNVDCVCLVSLNGRLVDFEDIQYYSERGLLVIEDQAEAFLSKYELSSATSGVVRLLPAAVLLHDPLLIPARYDHDGDDRTRLDIHSAS